MPIPSLNFGAPKSGEGITNATDIQALNPRKSVDLSNLRINKSPKPETGAGAITPELELDEGLGGGLESLQKTGQDFTEQAGGFGVEEETPLTPFTVQPEKKQGMFSNLADSIIPQASADNDIGLDETKIAEFIQVGVDRGLSREQIEEGYNIGIQEGAFNIEVEEVEEEVEGNTGFLDKAKAVVETPGRFVGAGVSQLPEIVGNLGGFFVGKPIDALLEKVGVDAPSLEEQFKSDGIENKEQFQEILGINPEDFTTGVGEFGAEVGTLFIPGGQAKLVAKFPQASAKIAQLGNAITKLGANYPRVFNTLKSAVTGAKEFAKFEAVSEGEVTPEGVALGAVANPVIGTTIKGIGKISKALAAKLELSGLLNPAKLDKVASQLREKGIESISSVSDYLLGKNIKGSKEKIVKTLFGDATKSRKIVDNALKKTGKETFDESSNKAIKTLIENVSKGEGVAKLGLEDDLIRFTKLQDKLAKKGLTSTEKNAIKRDMDEFINIFKDSGDVIAGTTKKGASNIRGGLQKQIENEAGASIDALKVLKDAGYKTLKDANKNTQVSFTLAESIARKDASDQASALINAFAPSGAGAIIGGVGSQGDVWDRLQGALTGAVIGKVAGSTTVKTNVASALNRLSGIEKLALKEFVDSKGVKELGAGILNKLTNND